MPAIKKTYALDKKTGVMVETTPEELRPITEALARDTRRVRRRMKQGSIQRSASYPYESEAMAVDPEDIPMARAIALANGLNTEYTRTGEPIITSASHRLEHMRAFDFYDRNGVSSPRNR